MKEIFTHPLGRALVVLPLVIIGNTIFGAVLSGFKDSYNKETFKAGFIKGMTVYIGIALLCLVSVLSIDLKIDFGGSLYTLIDAMYLIVWGAVIAYATDAISKLAKIFDFKVNKGESE